MGSGYFFGGSGIPLANAEDVKTLLAQEYQWKEHRSAFEAANSWFDADGIPPSIRAVLSNASNWASAELVKATFEKQTPLDKHGRPSQTDVLAIVRLESGPAILGVEAKVNETFGPTVDVWRAGGSDGKHKRIAGLAERLEIAPDIIGPLRYQLFHRSAAALIEAEAAGAKDAALVIQSFGDVTLRAGFDDFQAFAQAIGAPVHEPGGFSREIVRSGIRFRLGWAQDQIRAKRNLG